MARCRYCKYDYGGHHSPRCPDDPKSVISRQTRLAAYNLGYRAGRSGDRFVVGEGIGPAADSWHLGHSEGNIALEEAQNGYDPRFDE